MTPSPETIATLEAIATEIGAGKSFSTDEQLASVWNYAHDRALQIISSYRRGEGLFQITGKIKAGPRVPSVGPCTLPDGHRGQCNGLPESTCPGGVR